MASSTAETLITEMVLDASKYASGAQKVVSLNNSLMRSFQLTQQAAASMQAALGNLSFGSGNTFNFGAGGSGGGGGLMAVGGFYMGLRIIREVEGAVVSLDRQMIRLGVDALSEFASFDTLDRTFIGIYGSAQRATQMMTYLRDVAQTSAFHFRDLADAARGLSVIGLDVNRWLPITQGFAAAMGNISGEGLEDFVSILRRLQGGNMQLALGPRGIGRYGVGREELEGAGAIFDAHGHFTGTVEQALDALETVFKRRITGIADQVTQSFEVVESDLRDSIQEATIDFGAGLADNFTRPMKDATAAINEMRKAGVWKDLGDTISEIVGLSDVIGGNSSGAHNQLRKAKDVLKDVPVRSGDALQPDRALTGGWGVATLALEVIGTVLGARFGGIKGAFLGGAAGMYVGHKLPEWFGGEDNNQGMDGDDRAVGHALLDALDRSSIKGLLLEIAADMVTLVELTKISVEEYASVAKTLLPGGRVDPNTPLGMALGAGDAFYNTEALGMYNDAFSRQRHPEWYGGQTAPVGGPGFGADHGDDELGKIRDASAESAAYTKRMHEDLRAILQHMDMRATAFGGGDLGRIGATPVELSQYRRGAGQNIHALGESFGRSLQDLVDRAISDAFAHGLRQGYVGGNRG